MTGNLGPGHLVLDHQGDGPQSVALVPEPVLRSRLAQLFRFGGMMFPFLFADPH